MGKKKLHPSVAQFKEFVKENPKIIQEVRYGKATWKELYEDWYLLGEEDSRWDSYRNEKTIPNENSKSSENKDENSSSTNKVDMFNTVINTLKNMDVNQVQQQLGHVSQALAAVQGVISQFQGGKGNSTPPPESKPPSHPFSFRKD